MASESASTASNPTAPATLVIQPEDGRRVNAFGQIVNFKLDGTQTNNALTIALIDTPPDNGPPPHVHHLEDEIFIVVEGRLRFLANGTWTDALPVGSIVYTPRGVVHSFQNIGDTPGKSWVMATPSGFETFFSRCEEVFAVKDAPPDMARIISISTDHGIEYVPPLAVDPPPVHV